MHGSNHRVAKAQGASPILGVVLAFVSLTCPDVRAAEVIGDLEATRLSSVKFPAGSAWVYSGDGVPSGVAVRTARGMTVALNDSREFLLDEFGTFLVAEQTGSFVTFTPRGGDLATEWDLAFYGADGNEVARSGQVHGFSRIAISETGAVAVAGTIKQPPQDEGGPVEERVGIVLYDARGNEISRRLFHGSPVISAVAVDPTGTRVAVGWEQTVEGAGKRWQVQVQDFQGRVLWAPLLPEPLQGLRFTRDPSRLLILSKGALRAVEVEEGRKALPKPVRLPAGHYVAGPGRVFFRSGKLLAVAERPSAREKGRNTWHLLAAEPQDARMKIVDEGQLVTSGQSPGFSTVGALGVGKWPGLSSPRGVRTLNLSGLDGNTPSEE